ncbi:phytase [Kineosporia sp. A_224]|uniref:phytase n=1 Tax=Kineosporia sp. A_224 TaxID=1962180 RepID=UPI000B4B1D1B|nr:phytase [Kineosporia sp. A_224]
MRLTRGTVLGTVVAVAATAGVVAVGAAGGSAAATARTVLPVAETQVFPSGSGDIADDSAIWVDASDPANSVVLADNKAGSGGVATYDLAGRLLQYLPVGQVGNIDVRDGVLLGGGSVALVGANNRTTNTIMFWTLDRVTHALTPVSARAITTLTPNYGFCLYRSPVTGTSYAFVTQSGGGLLEQYELFETAGAVDARLVRSLAVGSQSEGCVADDERGLLYVGEEDVALWRYGAEPGAGAARVAVDTVGAGRLVADIEGLTLTYGPGGAGHLVVSSQGDSTVAVYERGGDNAYVRSVTVGASGTVDKVSSTDGVAAYAGDLGGAFTGGLLVVHDASNTGGTMSNLKYVPLDAVTAADPPPPPPGTSVSVTLPVVADTYLDASTHGGSTTLRVSATTLTTLLRFDATAVPATATVTSAVLEPYSPSTKTCRYEVHAAGNTWVEKTVKASTAPAVDPVVLGTSASLGAKVRVPVALPVAAVQKGAAFTLAVKGAPGCSLGYLSSRETANGARLVVTYTTG